MPLDSSRGAVQARRHKLVELYNDGRSMREISAETGYALGSVKVLLSQIRNGHRLPFGLTVRRGYRQGELLLSGTVAEYYKREASARLLPINEMLIETLNRVAKDDLLNAILDDGGGVND